MRKQDPKTGKFVKSPVSFNESIEKWAKSQAKEQGISEDEVVKNLLSKEFMIVEFDESTGTANLKLYQDDSKDVAIEKMDGEALYNLYRDLRENFAPVSAGIEYHKAFLCGSGFNVIVDDPSDKHKLAMKDEINLLSSKVYFDYYRKGLDRILWILSDDLLTFGGIASEIIYEKQITFEDFAEKQSVGGWKVRLVQDVKTSEWKTLKGIMRLKTIDKAILRLTPHINPDDLEIIYWGLDEKVKESVTDEIKKAVGRKGGKTSEEEMGTKLLPWQTLWLSWNTRGTSLKGESIIRPVLDLAIMVKKILAAVGKGFEHWADRKYFFVCGSEKRPWNKQAIHNFIQYLGLMIKNKWTGLPVPQGFDVKEIGGTVFEGTNIINYLIGLICSGMNYPRDFLEYGRTRAGDKAWLAWQVKYGSNQRQLRRDVEHQLFQKHLWARLGKTYKVAKQGVQEADRETADIYIPKIIWHAEGRWQQAEELKTLQGWLNVANPIGAEFKLAIEKRAAEILGFGEIEFPSFQEVRREMKQWQRQNEIALAEKEAKLKTRQEQGVSKKLAPTGTEKKAPPPAGGTRKPATIKPAQKVEESTLKYPELPSIPIEIRVTSEPIKSEPTKVDVTVKTPEADEGLIEEKKRTEKAKQKTEEEKQESAKEMRKKLEES